MQRQLGKHPWLFPVDVQPMRPSFKGDNKLKFEINVRERNRYFGFPSVLIQSSTKMKEYFKIFVKI